MKTLNSIQLEIRLAKIKKAEDNLLNKITRNDEINTALISKICDVDCETSWSVIVSLMTGGKIYETTNGAYRLY